jgi:hypothetical protein
MQMYSLEELIKTFKEHAIQARKNNEELLKQFIENNPGAPIPEWCTQEFCISTALAAMCEEILHIRNKISGSL